MHNFKKPITTQMRVGETFNSPKKLFSVFCWHLACRVVSLATVLAVDLHWEISVDFGRGLSNLWGLRMSENVVMWRSGRGAGGES